MKTLPGNLGKFKGRARSLHHASTLIMALVVGGCSLQESQIKMPPPYTQGALHIALDGLWRDVSGNVSGVSGIATNVSGHDLLLCSVSLNLLDDAGVKVTEALATTNGLQLAQQWRFQATFSNPFSTTFTSIAPGVTTCLPSPRASRVEMGHSFDLAKADQLIPGVSTETDAKILLDEPISITTNPKNGHQLLIWQYFDSTGVGTNIFEKLAISFDKDGKMIIIIQRVKI